MNRFNVVISSTMGTAREVFVRELGPQAVTTFLADVGAHERKAALDSADVLIALDPTVEISRDELAGMRQLKFVQLLTAGADRVPPGLFRHDLPLGNTSGATAPAIAEHILALVLGASKRLVFEHNQLSKGDWGHRRLNRILNGKTAGILGYGKIGQCAGSLLRCIGMRVEAINRSGQAAQPPDFLGTLQDLDEVLRRVDVLILTMSLNAATRNLISARHLRSMKRDAILVISSRGAIVDQRDLYEHLLSNPEFVTCVDTWWSEPAAADEPFVSEYPFLSLPNFIGSPHNSGMVSEMRDRLAIYAARNVTRFMSGDGEVTLVKNEDRP